MTNNPQDNNANNQLSLEQLTTSLDAMHLAQLTAFAFAIPQLYFCREYLQQDEQEAIKLCLQRLQRGLNEAQFSIASLTELLTERDYFDSEEARLRLAPEPDFESLGD